MQLYKRLCSSVSTLIRWSVRGHRVEKWENEPFGYFLCMFECWGWVGEWMGFGCPCLPVRNDIVTPRHLLLNNLNDCLKLVLCYIQLYYPEDVRLSNPSPVHM